MTAPSNTPPRKRLDDTGRRYWFVPAAFAVGLAMTLTSLLFQVQAGLKHEEQHLRTVADERVGAVAAAVADHLSLITDMRTVMRAAGEEMDWREYDAIAGDLVERHQVIQALDWVRRVPHAERADFEARMRASGLREYRITERAADGHLVPAGVRDAYFPVVFTANIAVNRPVLGFDAASEPVSRAALERARESGAMAASRRFRLFAEVTHEWGTVIFAPVHAAGRAGQAAASETEGPDAAPVGYIGGVLRPSELGLPAATDAAPKVGFNDYVFDGPRPVPETLIHARATGPDGAKAEPPPFDPAALERGVVRTIPIADRHWTVASVPAPTPYRLGFDEWVTLIVGLIGATLIAAYILDTIRRSETLRREAAERKRLERRLEVASQVVEQSPVMVSRWEFVPDAPIDFDRLVPEYVSDNVQMLGLAADNLTSGKVNFFHCVHPEDRAALKESLESAARQGRRQAVDRFRFVRPDGDVRWVEGTMTLERDAEGRSVRGLGTLRDITDAKRAEEALEFANTVLAAQMESSPDGILVIGADGRVVSYNRQIPEFGHMSPEFLDSATDEEMVQAVAAQVKDPEGFRSTVAYFKDHPDAKIDNELEFADGRIFEQHVRSLRDSHGRNLGHVVFLRDVTARKRAEEALRESEEKFRMLVEASPDFVWETDENDVFTYASPQVKDILGYKPEEILGITPLDLMPVAEASRIRQIFGDLRSERRPFSQIRNTLIAKDGREVIVETSGVPIIDSGGVFHGYHGSDRDVTEAVILRRQFVARLRSALDAMPVAVSWARLSDGVIEFANRKFAETYGYTAEDLTTVSEWVANCYPVETQRERAEAAWFKFFENPTDTEFEIAPVEVDVLCKNGTVKTVLHGGVILPQAGWALGTFVDISEAKERERALAQTTRDLGERMKEMSLLVEYSKHRLNREESATPVLAWLAKAMPAAWQFPEIAAARVTLDGKAFTSENFRETDWRQHAEIRVAGEVRGGIEVVYVEPPPDTETPFLAEEQSLIDGLARDTAFFIERVDAERKLRTASRIVDNSPTVLFRVRLEPGLPCVFISDNVAQYGYDAQEMCESGMDIETIIHPQDVPAVREAIERAVETGTDNFELEIRVRTADGAYIWSNAKITVIHDSEGRPVGLEGISVDVTKRREAETKIAHMAAHDSLTGLANRAVFVENTEREIARARRWGTSLAILYLDLDNFKDVNDTRGHRFGDVLLQGVAERLMSHLRESDTVARFGGDEFGVLQTDLDDPEKAAMLANKLVDIIGRPFVIEGVEIRIGASVGIDVLEAGGSGGIDAETLLAHADMALYRAKAEGRSTFRFFTDAMNEEIQTRVHLENELRTAIESGQLFLEYQPQVDIRTGRMIGVEALVRWRHPTRGVLPPGAFIPAAEKSGLIIALGQWVLRTAAHQARIWVDAGLMVRVTGINVSNAQFATGINVSAAQFRIRGELEKSIERTLADTGLPAGMLELELTESTVMETFQKQNDVLTRLRKSGVRIAIDDFGTGYSSLQYLRKFPVDRIKIAQEFVLGLKADSGDAAIVKAAIGLAQALELRVIAEGVETREQLELLRRWGCPEAQGFYFSRPVAPEVIESYLRAGGILPQRTATARHSA